VISERRLEKNSLLYSNGTATARIAAKHARIVQSYSPGGVRMYSPI